MKKRLITGRTIIAGEGENMDSAFFENSLSDDDLKKDLKKFDYIIMNPPYDGSLHLKCLEQALNFKKEGGTLINLSPCGWLEDLSYLYKGIGTTRQRFSELAERISDLKIISAARANELFGIYYPIYELFLDGLKTL